MAWEIELTEQVEKWLLEELTDEERRQIVPAIDALEEHGPTLGRPAVERIKSSQHHKMKELRSLSGNLRVLFAFDPTRAAILLVAGNKTGQWKRWYAENIPVADAAFDDHLRRQHNGPNRKKQTLERGS